MAVFLLLALCALLGFKLLLIKRSMGDIKEQLSRTRETGYNKQLTISLADKTLSSMAAEINENLSFQSSLKLRFEQAERSVRESVSDIAHDLRTPLTVIKGNLQMLENSPSLSDKDKAYIAVCKEKSDLLRSMADDFFELSLLESDSTPPALKKVNIINLLMEFLAENEAVITANSLTPEIKFPEKTVFIYADEALLLRMLSNLLNNVLKYAKGSFGIEVRAEEDRLDILFSNNIGSEADFDPARLFDRTYRGDRARGGQGAGLGLYIVKLLCEKQGGKVTAFICENRLFIKMSFKAILHNYCRANAQSDFSSDCIEIPQAY